MSLESLIHLPVIMSTITFLCKTTLIFSHTFDIQWLLLTWKDFNWLKIETVSTSWCASRLQLRGIGGSTATDRSWPSQPRVMNWSPRPASFHCNTLPHVVWTFLTKGQLRKIIPAFFRKQKDWPNSPEPFFTHFISQQSCHGEKFNNKS